MPNYYHSNPAGHLSKDEREQRKKINKNIASFKDISHYAPNWLDDDAKKVYKEIIKNEQKGSLKALDKYSLSIFCATYVAVANAGQHLRKEGLIIKGKENPYYRPFRQLSEALRKQANDLALSPASRSRFVLNETKKEDNDLSDDPMKDFLE